MRNDWNIPEGAVEAYNEMQARFDEDEEEVSEPRKCNVCSEDALEVHDCCKTHEIEAWQQELADPIDDAYADTCRKELAKLGVIA